MSIIKPVVTIEEQPAKILCPICGKASYSRGGIHPQCAMQQADEPRTLKLREARKAEVKAAGKARPRSWKKRCPKCGTSLHVRREQCECGHKFGGR